MEEINAFSLQILIKPLVFTANDMFQYNWNLILMVLYINLWFFFNVNNNFLMDFLDNAWNNYISSNWYAIYDEFDLIMKAVFFSW